MGGIFKKVLKSNKSLIEPDSADLQSVPATNKIKTTFLRVVFLLLRNTLRANLSVFARIALEALAEKTVNPGYRRVSYWKSMK